jgi:hypothetical protein
MKQRRGLLHQQPAYVRGLFTEQSVYVRGLTQDRVRTPLYLSKNEKIRQSYRAGTTGMHPGGDQNPLTDSENLKET